MSVRMSLLVALLSAPVSARAAARAAPQRNTPATLRAAINDLEGTFGTRYPNAAKYLARLAKIETDLTGRDETRRTAARAAFDALQREALVANPHVSGQPWLVEVREQYWHCHGTMGTMFQTGDDHKRDCGGLKGWRGDGGRLEVITFGPGGKVAAVRKLAAAPKGVLRDPDVSFDGKRVLFSMRRGRADDYHLYEINIDGAGLNQLTFGSMLSDVDPIYLPGGKVLFSSTRDMKYCHCNRHIQPNLFVMDADGANIIQVSRNTLGDFHSSLMPDGRVLYSRWEYVDRHFGPSLGLWTTNPDGTSHLLFMGNNAWTPGFIGDARAIPGTEKVVCIYGSCHDLPWGALVVVNRTKGLDGPGPIEHIWPAEARRLVPPADSRRNFEMRHKGSIDAMHKLKGRYEDPWPLHDTTTGKGGGKVFMASRSIGPPKGSARLPSEQFERIVTWIDLNGVYYGNYSSVYPGRNPIADELGQLLALAGMRNHGQHLKTHGALVCFDRPRLSPILAKVGPVGSEKYARAIEIISLGAKRLKQQAREDMLGCKTVPVDKLDVFRAKRRRRDLAEQRKSLQARAAGAKHYQYKAATKR